MGIFLTNVWIFSFYMFMTEYWFRLRIFESRISAFKNLDFFLIWFRIANFVKEPFDKHFGPLKLSIFFLYPLLYFLGKLKRFIIFYFVEISFHLFQFVHLNLVLQNYFAYFVYQFPNLGELLQIFVVAVLVLLTVHFMIYFILLIIIKFIPFKLTISNLHS